MGNNDSKLGSRQSSALKTSNEAINSQRNGTVNRIPQPGPVAVSVTGSVPGVSHTQPISTVSSLSRSNKNPYTLHASPNPSNMPLTPSDKSKSFSYQKSSLSGRGEDKINSVSVNVKPTCKIQNIVKSENLGSIKVIGCDVVKNITDERSLPLSQTNEKQEASVTDQIKLDSSKNSLPAVQRDVRHVPDFGNRMENKTGNPFLLVESNQSLKIPAFHNKLGSEIGCTDLMNSPPPKVREHTIKENAQYKALYKPSEITPKYPKKNMTFLENPSSSNEKYSPVKEDTFKAAGYAKQKPDLSGMFTERNVFEKKEDTSLLHFETKNSTRDDKLFTNSSVMGLNEERNAVHLNSQKLVDRQRRKNLSTKVGIRNHSLKLTTCTALKHVEKIADSLNTLNNSNVTRNIFDVDAVSKELSLVSVDSEKNDLYDMIPARKYSLVECIFHMKNLDIKNKNKVSSLQQSLIFNVQEVNQFVMVLKSCPILNKEIITEIDILKDNLTSLAANSSNQHSVSREINSSVRPDEIKSNENTCVVVSKNTNGTRFNTQQHTNCRHLVNLLSGASLQYNLKTVKKTEKIEIDTAKQKAVGNLSETSFFQSDKLNDEKSNVPKEENVISLDSFITLLDQLPDDLVKEKNNVHLRRTFLYCRICEKSVAFAVSNLVEHLRGKTHKKLLGEKTLLEDIPTPPEQKDVPKETSILLAKKYVPQNPIPLPPKYEGVLNIVLRSCMEGLLLNVSLYFCRPCDFLTNNEEDANNHVVDDNHKKQVSEQATWHFCNSCSMNIYGTDIHIKEHDLTNQHIEVMKLKSGNEQNNASEEVLSLSLHSSTSDLNKKGCKRLKPHEILLAIAKESQARSTGASLGLYCHICNWYLVYKTTSAESHYSSELHIKNLSLKPNKDECKITFCSICQVDIFGDQTVLNEHAALQLHVEMANSMANSSNLENSESESDEKTNELSNENGPHFDLMKSVIKKHLTNEPKYDIWGFYCHICEAFSLNNKDWKNHLSTSSHSNRINSSECVRKKMLHECLVCNIQLICHDDVFTLHEKSLAHHAVSRRLEKDNACSVDKEEYSTEDGSDDSESSEDDDDDSMTNGSDSTSTSSSNKNANNDRKQQNKKTLTKCVQITKLPVNIQVKEVFEVFKDCGYIKKCRVNEKHHSCTVLFATNEGAAKALRLKNYEGACYIKGTKVSIDPVAEPRKRRNKKVSLNAVLSANVVATLQSAASLKALMNSLQEEMVQEAIQRGQRSNQIKCDLAKAIPGCKVHMFGSQVTGLASKQSDFDIYIDYDNRSYFKDLPQVVQANVIQKLLDLFTKPRSPFRVTESVLVARVPILRVVHLQSNVPCDISCRSGLSVENSNLIRLLVNSDHRVKWLVIMVKWWMRANDLLDRTIFTSYAITWLVLFFLMRLPKPVLCSVFHLRKPCPQEQSYSIAGWDCQFAREIRGCFTTDNNQSNCELLRGFFNFYGTFRFQSPVLCPLTAALIPRKNFDELKIPFAYKTYVNKVKHVPNPETLRTNTPICLQDPFDLAHNVTKGVNFKNLQRFQVLCLSSARICAN